MSEDWKLIRVVAMLSDFSVVHLKILLALVQLELQDRESEVKNG